MVSESGHTRRGLVRKAEMVSDALSDALQQVHGGPLPAVHGNMLSGHLRAFLVPVVGILCDMQEGTSVGPTDLIREITEARKEKRIGYLLGQLETIHQIRSNLDSDGGAALQDELRKIEVRVGGELSDLRSACGSDARAPGPVPQVTTPPDHCAKVQDA